MRGAGVELIDDLVAGGLQFGVVRLSVAHERVDLGGNDGGWGKVFEVAVDGRDLRIVGEGGAGQVLAREVLQERRVEGVAFS